VTPQEEADVEVLYAAMYVLSRSGRSDGASICAKVISELRAGAVTAGAA
jgi:hypothetical protein